MRSQLEQKGSETGLMNPSSPAPSAKRKRRGVDDGRGRELLQRPAALDDGADLGAGEDLIVAPCLVGVERHELDEAHDVGLAPRELGERGDLGLGEAADGDAVDLDRPQLGVPLGLGEPRQDAVERVAAGDLGEADVRERVQRDVDASQPGRDERAREPVEQDAVGREREVTHAGRRREHPHELGQVAAHERLAAGQPDLVDAHRGHDGDEALDLLEGEQLGLGQPRQALGGHAVAAAEVAAVGDRDAQAADRAAPAVLQRGRRRRRACRRQLGRR